MTVHELESQIAQLTLTITALESTAKTPTNDLGASLDAETRLEAAQRLRERLERQLSELQASEKRRQEKAERVAAQARLVELEAIYRGECSELARVIDAAARQLESTLSVVLEKRGELAALSNEYTRLYRQITGERPDVLQRPWQTGLVPGEVVPLSEPSALYGHVALALNLAVNEKEGGRFTLDAVLAAVTGATVPRDAENLPVATPKPVEDAPLTPMQQFARQRRVNYD